jgi:predicted deacylase
MIPTGLRTRVALARRSPAYDFWRLVGATLAGPRVVIFGGTHGDETEGVIAANGWRAWSWASSSGLVEVVPVGA